MLFPVFVKNAMQSKIMSVFLFFLVQFVKAQLINLNV